MQVGCTWFLQSMIHVDHKNGSLLDNAMFVVMKRDKKTGIAYPGYWVFPGETREGEESLEEVNLRGMGEELEFLPLTNEIQHVTTIYYPGNVAVEHFFWVPMDIGLCELNPHEGQDWRLMTLAEISRRRKLGFWCREVLPVLHRFLEGYSKYWFKPDAIREARYHSGAH